MTAKFDLGSCPVCGIRLITTLEDLYQAIDDVPRVDVIATTFRGRCGRCGTIMSRAVWLNDALIGTMLGNESVFANYNKEGLDTMNDTIAQTIKEITLATEKLKELVKQRTADAEALLIHESNATAMRNRISGLDREISLIKNSIEKNLKAF